MYLGNDDPAELAATPYLPSGGEPIGAPALDMDIQVDVAVVGGGIAGCSLALHAAGFLDVAVVEAKEVGWGASSRNAGHVAPATKLEPQEMIRLFGEEQGRRAIAKARSGPQLVFDLIERHGIDASVEKTGVLTAAHTAMALRKLERRANELQRLGYGVDLLGPGRTADVVGNDPKFYLGSVLDMDGGTLNPLSYVRGLARAAIAKGARFFEHSTATRIDEVVVGGTRKWKVQTPKGSVTAGKVVICTNGYTDDLWPGLRQTIVPVRAYQFLTAPIGTAMNARILPTRVGLTDTRRLMSGVRKYPDGRLHFSGIGPLFGAERRPFLDTSARRIGRMFPQLGSVRVDSWWSGWIAMTTENYWHVHQPAPGVMAMLGCNGRGVAIATILGRDIAGYLRDGREDQLMIPFSPLRRIPAYAVHRPLVRALVGYYQLRDALDDALRVAW